MSNLDFDILLGENEFFHQVNNYISSKQLYFFGILHFNQNIWDKYQYSK